MSIDKESPETKLNWLANIILACKEFSGEDLWIVVLAASAGLITFALIAIISIVLLVATRTGI